MSPSSSEIIEQVKSSPLSKVKLAVVDLDGVLRGKVIHLEKFLSAVEGGFGFCDVVFGWDAADKLYEGADFTGWHTGFPDAQARIDLNTYRQVPWDNDIPFFLADFVDQSGEGLKICPRTLLKTVAAKAKSMGYAPQFSQEFEWFNFRQDSIDWDGETIKRPQPISEGMFGYSLLRAGDNRDFFNDLFDLLARFKVPIEGLHTETGPGVYEAALLHTSLLEAGDRAVLFKAGVKEIARQYGIVPSFMARWHNDYPGCSGHLHQSLWDEAGKTNLFYDGGEATKMSALMKSYIAGLIHCMPHVLPLYAPTINSYKRLVEGAWAPTTMTWGIDNRTTAVRAIPGAAKSARLEMRVPGSDVNPYLAMAASLASGLYGIEKNLELETAETTGNGYEELGAGRLASSLQDATKLMEQSELANELLGEAFVKHFCQTRDWEWSQYGQAVTDWELKRYFETI